MSGEMGVIIHEGVGVEGDAISVFILEEEVVIALFDPLVLEEPVIVMTFPGDMEVGIVVEDILSGEIGHAS